MTGEEGRAIYNEKIEGWLRDLDVDTFGIADMSRYSEEITGIGDLTAGELPFAVSFGIVLSVGVLGTLKDGPTQLYLHHYRQLNYRLDMIGYFLGRSIEREGFRAIPFAASQVVDWQRQRGHINHKKVGHGGSRMDRPQQPARSSAVRVAGQVQHGPHRHAPRGEPRAGS